MNSLRLCFYNIPIYILLIIPLLMVNSIFAQENDDCLMCHSDNTLSGKKRGSHIQYLSIVKNLQDQFIAVFNVLIATLIWQVPIFLIKLM